MGTVFSFNEKFLLEILKRARVKNPEQVIPRLRKRFRSSLKLLNADAELLEHTGGISQKDAVFLNLVPCLSKYCILEKYEISNKKYDNENVCKFLYSLTFNEKREKLLALFYNSRKKLVRISYISTGSVFAANIDLDAILEHCEACLAKYVVISHNHVVSDCFPSADDLISTQYVKERLKKVDVELLDHVIVSRYGYYSMSKDKKEEFSV